MPSTTFFLCCCWHNPDADHACALFSFQSIVLVKSITDLVASTTFRLCFCWNNMFFPWHHLDAVPTLVLLIPAVQAGKTNSNGSEKLNISQEWRERVSGISDQFDGQQQRRQQQQQTTNNNKTHLRRNSGHDHFWMCSHRGIGNISRLVLTILCISCFLAHDGINVTDTCT